MKKLLVLFFALTGCLFVMAQADSLVQFSVAAKKVKDNIYEITATANIKAGWHLYGINKSVEGLEPLKFLFDYENVKLLGEINFNHTATTISDAVFSTKTNVFTGTLIAKQQIVISGIIPAKLKVLIDANLGRDAEFLQSEQKFEISLEGGVENINHQNIKIASILID